MEGRGRSWKGRGRSWKRRGVGHRLVTYEEAGRLAAVLEQRAYAPPGGIAQQVGLAYGRVRGGLAVGDRIHLRSRCSHTSTIGKPSGRPSGGNYRGEFIRQSRGLPFEEEAATLSDMQSDAVRCNQRRPPP